MKGFTVNRLALIVVGFFLVVSLGVAADKIIGIASGENKSSSEKKDVEKDVSEKRPIKVVDLRKKSLDQICKEIEEYGEVLPVAMGPHVWLGQRVEWCVDNFVRPDGWQLSGWSKVTLDRDFNPRRFKIGLISPEMYGDELVRLHGIDADPEELDYFRAKRVQPVFGVFFSREF
jgi:hypothetical protein